MITVRQDAVRTQGRAPKAEEINETAKQWVRHRGLKLTRRGCQMRHFCHSQHFEITGHTKPTFPY